MWNKKIIIIITHQPTTGSWAKILWRSSDELVRNAGHLWNYQTLTLVVVGFRQAQLKI